MLLFKRDYITTVVCISLVCLTCWILHTLKIWIFWLIFWIGETSLVWIIYHKHISIGSLRYEIWIEECVSCYWDDSCISIMISGYMWWFEIVSFNWLLRFIKTLDIHCISFYGYIWWFGLNRISFVICAKNGFIEWFTDFLKYSRTYIRFVWWELRMCIDEHENILL